MTTRELFELEFHVPECAIYDPAGNEYLSRSTNRDEEFEAELYNAKWIGFQAGAKRKQCAWAYDEYEDGWDTVCGNKFSFIDGTPTENKFTHCCYCGGELVEAAKEGK